MNENVDAVGRFADIDSLYKYYQDKGEKYSEIWADKVENTAGQVFDYLDPHGGVTQYISPQSMHSAIGFTHPFCTFSSYRASVEGSRSSKLIKILDENDLHSEKSNEFDKMPDHVEAAVRSLPNFQRDPAHIGLVWQGRLSGEQYSGLNHVGIWTHPETEKGFGFGLYSLYERVFGQVTEEATNEISTLKLYLSLGFKPVAVCNPVTGKELENMDVESAVIERINSGEAKSPFVVRLVRE